MELSTRGLVLAHADKLLLDDAVFKVSEKGRQRVISEQRKNVHAGVQGILSSFEGDIRDIGTLADQAALAKKLTFKQADTIDSRHLLEQGLPVTYDPYRFDSFVVRKELTPIYEADCVFMSTLNRVVMASL